MKEKKLTKRQKKMIKTHKERMYHLRVFNEDKCDCEETQVSKVGFQLGT